MCCSVGAEDSQFASTSIFNAETSSKEDSMTERSLPMARALGG